VQSFCSSFFQKACREPPAKRRSLSAESETLLNGLFFLVGAGARPVGDEASAINGKNKEH
jgi:hypothetical protein